MHTLAVAYCLPNANAHSLFRETRVMSRLGRARIGDCVTHHLCGHFVDSRRRGADTHSERVGRPNYGLPPAASLVAASRFAEQ